MSDHLPPSPRPHAPANSDPGPRALPRSDFATWKTLLALRNDPRRLSLQDAFLLQLDACRPDLVRIFRRDFEEHHVEDAAADVLARWCELVRAAKPLRAPRKGSWLSLLCGQVKEKLRPRRTRSDKALPRPMTESLHALGDVVADWRTAGPDAGDFVDFLRFRAKHALSPGEFALLDARLAELTGVTPVAAPALTPATERVLTCRLRSWLRDIMNTA